MRDVSINQVRDERWQTVLKLLFARCESPICREGVFRLSDGGMIKIHDGVIRFSTCSVMCQSKERY